MYIAVPSKVSFPFTTLKSSKIQRAYVSQYGYGQFDCAPLYPRHAVIVSESNVQLLHNIPQRGQIFTKLSQTEKIASSSFSSDISDGAWR